MPKLVVMWQFEPVKQKGLMPVRQGLPNYKTWQMWMARSSRPPHIFLQWTPLNHAQDKAMLLVEWALTPMGHSWPKEEYASLIASIIHLDSLCFVTGDPLVRPLKHTKSCSDCLKGAEHSIYIFNDLTGLRRFKP